MFAIARNFSGKNCEKLWPRPTLDEVSAIGRCSAGAGLLRQQDAVGWHIVQRARVGDAAVPVGRHLVIVRGGAAALGVTVTALVGLRRKLEILRCVLGRGLPSLIAAGRGRGRWEAREAWRRRPCGGRGVPEFPWDW